jgi:hypothetical protein
MGTDFSTSVKGAVTWSWNEGKEAVEGEPSLWAGLGPRLERLKAFVLTSIARTLSDRGRVSPDREGGGRVPTGERGISCVALKYAIEDCLRDGGGRERVVDGGSTGDDSPPDVVLIGEDAMYRLVRFERTSPDSYVGVPRGLDMGDSRDTPWSCSGRGTELAFRLEDITVEETGEDGELDMKDGCEDECVLRSPSQRRTNSSKNFHIRSRQHST